ncbi:MAG: sensor histidine kinase [Mangrovibacterium sp.]
MNLIIKIILHLFYWMVFCVFAGALGFRLTEGFDFIVQHIPFFLFHLSWAAIQFYGFYFFLYRFIEKQQYIYYLLWSVTISVALSVTLTLLYNMLAGFHPAYTIIEFLPQSAGTFIIGQTGSLLKGFIRWFDDIQHKQEVEKLLLQNELDMLNAQLNPHFLFNTLNNIDSLIRFNPDKASESLITLSEIMRYMLYDAKKTKVPLRSEVIHYRNIIRLQLLRLKDPSKVTFTTALENEATEVAPLLFLPFLENAFKYALFDPPGPTIEIGLRSAAGRIGFSCSNFCGLRNETVRRKTGGIGLANLKRRLELLYPGKHKLEIRDENSYFSVQLILEP